MSSEYQIGRDFESLNQRLEETERELRYLKERCDCGSPFPLLFRDADGAVVDEDRIAIDEELEKSSTDNSVQVVWDAMDEAQGRRVTAPNGTTLVTFFSFILEGVTFESGWGGFYDAAPVREAVKPRAMEHFENDRSMIESRFHRPTGYRKGVLVAGWVTSGWWWFDLVDYKKADSRYCGGADKKFSWFYNGYGHYKGYACGWQNVDTSVHNGDIAGTLRFRFGDADREWGIHFGLGFQR